jgi:sulfhydrogenase subunit beta (sulfur reductase)
MVMPTPYPPESGQVGLPSAPTWDGSALFLPRDRLDDLIGLLRGDGRRVIGRVVEDGALKMVEIDHAADLPFGWTAEAAPGVARLARRGPGHPGATRAFDNGPAWQGIKPWTFPSRVDSLAVELSDDGHVSVRIKAPEPVPTAVIGARVLPGGPSSVPVRPASRTRTHTWA